MAEAPASAGFGDIGGLSTNIATSRWKMAGQKTVDYNNLTHALETLNAAKGDTEKVLESTMKLLAPLPKEPHPDDVVPTFMQGVLEKQSLRDPKIFHNRWFELDMAKGILIFWDQSTESDKHYIELSKIYEVGHGFDQQIPERPGCDFQILYSPGKVMRLRAARQRDCENWVTVLAPYASGRPPPSKPLHDPSLPSGWKAAMSSKGRIFYYNKATNQKSWTPPNGGGSGRATSPARRTTSATALALNARLDAMRDATGTGTGELHQQRQRVERMSKLENEIQRMRISRSSRGRGQQALHESLTTMNVARAFSPSRSVGGGGGGGGGSPRAERREQLQAELALLTERKGSHKKSAAFTRSGAAHAVSRMHSLIAVAHGHVDTQRRLDYGAQSTAGPKGAEASATASKLKATEPKFDLQETEDASAPIPSDAVHKETAVLSQIHELLSAAFPDDHAQRKRVLEGLGARTDAVQPADAAVSSPSPPSERVTSPVNEAQTDSADGFVPPPGLSFIQEMKWIKQQKRKVRISPSFRLHCAIVAPLFEAPQFDDHPHLRDGVHIISRLGIFQPPWGPHPHPRRHRRHPRRHRRHRRKRRRRCVRDSLCALVALQTALHSPILTRWPFVVCVFRQFLLDGNIFFNRLSALDMRR
eukprot:SAG11_NODE_1077_length_5964_cov_9.493265_2_plen_647_part_00